MRYHESIKVFYLNYYDFIDQDYRMILIANDDYSLVLS